MDASVLIQQLRSIRGTVQTGSRSAAIQALADLIIHIDREDKVAQVRASLKAIEANPEMDVLGEVKRLADSLEPF